MSEITLHTAFGNCRRIEVSILEDLAFQLLAHVGHSYRIFGVRRCQEIIINERFLGLVR